MVESISGMDHGSSKSVPSSNALTDGKDKLFQHAFDYAAIGMALIALDGTWLKVNPALSNISGYSSAELMKTDIAAIIHADDLKSLQRLHSRLLSSRKDTYNKEIRCYHKQGHIIWGLLYVSLVRDEAGAPLYTIAQIQDISARKQLEQKFSSLIEYNPAGIISLDMHGRMNGLNEAMEQIIGYKSYELMDKPLKTIIAGEREHLHIFQHAVEDKEQYNHDITVTHKDGSLIHLGAKDVPIIVDGTIVGFYIIARDITEHRMTQEKLGAIQQELIDVVSKQHGMTYKFKKIGDRFIHTLCDGELVYRLGYRPEFVVGKELSDFPVESGSIAQIEECYNRAWSGEETVTYEGQKNNLTYLIHMKPVKRSGKVVEVIASCIDISERKRAEEDLRATKEMLESFINNTPDAIDVVDLNGNVVQVNRAFEKIYGYTEEEALGKQLLIIPEDKTEEKDMLYSKLTSGTDIENYETTRLRKDGSLLYINLTLSTIKDANGKTIAYAAITRDITERKKTEELLRKSDRLSVVGQLAAGLAHEIRNPLTSLKGFLQLMQAGVPSQEKYYEIMISELDRINFIVSEFLIIAKPQVTQYDNKSLNRILDTVIQLIEPEANMKNVEMQVDMGLKPVLVRCSEIQLKQVFINLMKNAIEAMPQGGQLKIDVDNGEQDVLVRIADTGSGIPKERLSHLGEPFYTTKEKGTGLGLMMCFKIIESHQGSIDFRSQLHEGTTVEVVLPVVQPYLK
ncbi:PAS domain S-box protein [Paenibacillus sp. TAB 01]|uniref:PAS domain S-box protein n=1 Tax=Paenibacillus sp. TAB 01 TaxID=3368988 RepID=UPI003753349F